MTSGPDERPALVEARHATRIFAADDTAVTAIDRISFSVAPGEFVAIEGASGSGKSTLLHLLGGLDLATTGSVRFEGRDYAAMDDDVRSTLRRTGIGLMLPVVDLIASLTVWENVAVARLLAGQRLGGGRQRARELLDQIGLSARSDVPAGRLSAGEAQRVALARALFSRPRLLLLDEPTSSLDSVRADEMLGLLRQVAGDGPAIVMVTHNARAAAFADRSVRLCDGRVVVP